MCKMSHVHKWNEYLILSEMTKISSFGFGKIKLLGFQMEQIDGFLTTFSTTHLNFLIKLKTYREEGRLIVYTDKT